MAKGLVKKGTHGLVPVDIKEQAKQIYLSSFGKMSFTAIGGKLKVNRNTVAKWAKVEKWDVQIAAIERRAGEEITERVATKYADKIEPLLEEAIGTMRIFAHFARVKAMEHDEKGRPVTDAQGQPVMNKAVTEASLNTLTNVIVSYYKTMRLHSGMTTDNNGVTGDVTSHVTGDVTHTVKDDGVKFMKALNKALASGGEDTQDALLNFCTAVGDAAPDGED